MTPFLLIFGVACLAGGCVAFWPSGAQSTTIFRLLQFLLAGLLLLHVWLEVLAIATVPWGPSTTLLPLGVAGVGIVFLLRRAAPRQEKLKIDIGGGDAVAAGAVAVLAYCAHNLWIVTSDFFYHWGPKGKRFYLARGIDLEYLTQPWNHLVVPWYPTLLPKLYALTALVRGSFSEPDMMWWSVLWIVMVLIAAREVLLVSLVRKDIAQSGIAFLGAMLVTVCLQIRLVGGADWMIAVALMVGCRALIEPSGENDRVAALAAGFGAAAKIEGIVLAFLLLAIYSLRRRIVTGYWNLKSMLCTASPAILVVAVWFVQSLRHHLFPAAAPGDLQPLRWYVVMENVLESLRPPALYGFGLLLLLLPVLFISRRTRWIGIVAALQVLFYLFVYYISPADPAIYIRTSFARVAFHLIPTVFIALLLLTARGPQPVRLEGPKG